LKRAKVLGGDRRETVATKKVVRNEVKSDELDRKFRELNAAQLKVNARLAVEQIVELKGGREERDGKKCRTRFEDDEGRGGNSRQ